MKQKILKIILNINIILKINIIYISARSSLHFLTLLLLLHSYLCHNMF